MAVSGLAKRATLFLHHRIVIRVSLS